MELLTPDGWSQAYRMESVILQTMATMIKGEAVRDLGSRQPK
jgi:hypothetical protein